MISIFFQHLAQYINFMQEYTVAVKVPASLSYSIRSLNPPLERCLELPLSNSRLLCVSIYSSLENLFDTMSCIIPLSVSLSLSYSLTVDTDSSSPPTPLRNCPQRLLKSLRVYCRYYSVAGMIDNVVHRSFELKQYLSHTLELRQ